MKKNIYFTSFRLSFSQFPSLLTKKEIQWHQGHHRFLCYQSCSEEKKRIFFHSFFFQQFLFVVDIFFAVVAWINLERKTTRWFFNFREFSFCWKLCVKRIHYYDVILWETIFLREHFFNYACKKYSNGLLYIKRKQFKRSSMYCFVLIFCVVFFFM